MAENESESIINQKNMLVSYALAKSWEIYDIYVDEDFSGADSTRPEFNRLLNDAENFKFDIVLCKTQSRFSRDMEIIEKYIHNKFAEWGIRFVSLVDNADTSVKGNKKARQINGLINEWYLEDISENIKAVLRFKKQQGKFTGSSAPYGYKKDPGDRNRLIIDDMPADIVRSIFKSFLEGKSYRQISDYLNERNIPTPAKYKITAGNAMYGRINKTPVSDLWTRDTIRHILKNKVYIGTLVQGKSHTVSYKNRRKLQVPKNDWIVVSNVHEPIIDKESWEAVQNMLARRTRSEKYTNNINPFSGIVYCGICGGKFIKCISNGYEYLRCRTVGIDRQRCCNNRRIRIDELDTLILSEINSLIKLHYDENMIGEFILAYNRESLQNNNLSEKQKSLSNEFNKIKLIQRKMYGDMALGILSKDDYLLFNSQYNDELEAINNKLADIALEASEAENNTIYKFEGIDKLTREIVLNFIEKIEIGVFEKECKIRDINILWNV